MHPLPFYTLYLSTDEPQYTSKMVTKIGSSRNAGAFVKIRELER